MNYKCLLVFIILLSIIIYLILRRRGENNTKNTTENINLKLPDEYWTFEKIVRPLSENNEDIPKNIFQTWETKKLPKFMKKKC